jgi:hypothetical protein
MVLFCGFVGAPARAEAPEVDWLAMAGVVHASGEGSGAPIPPGTAGLLRVRALARDGRLAVGGDLDERTTRILASRKTALVGLALPHVDLLTGVGVVERGLFGPRARVDLHVPLEVAVVAGQRATVSGRARVWWTWLDTSEERAPSRVPGTGGLELAAGFGVGSGAVRPRLELGYREEFGHDVWIAAVGVGR